MATAPPPATEQTPLLASLSKTNELVDRSPPRPYKKQNRFWHIVVTAAITLIVAIAVAVTVYFLFLKPKDDEDMFSLYRRIVERDDDYNKNDLNTLLGSSWPRQDALTVTYPASAYFAIVEEALDQGKQKLREVKTNETQLVDDYDEYEEDTATEKKHIRLRAARLDVNDSESDTDSGSSTVSQSTSAGTTSTTTETTSLPSTRKSTTRDVEESDLDSTSRLSDLGYVENEATKYLRDKNLHLVISYNTTKNLTWTNETGCAFLAQNITCEPSPYRTLDGFCNNVDNPRWGTAMKPLRRALPAAYADGVSAPRGGFNSNLTSAFNVSVHLETKSDGDEEKYSQMLTIWGALVNHDLSVVAKYTNSDGKEIDCCQSGRDNVECFPVIGNSTEEQNETCFNFVRSMVALRCSFGPREQLNEVSSFLDGSLVYGNTEYLGASLRKFANGLLEEAHVWLPPVRSAVEGYEPEASWGAAFSASSSRKPTFEEHSPWKTLSYDADMSSSYNPLGAWKPTYDPDGPWRLTYDPIESQWRESSDRKPASSSFLLQSSPHVTKAAGSWQSWYGKEVPWGKTDYQEDSFKLRKYGQNKGKKKSWKRKKYFSALGDFGPTEYAQAGSMRSILTQQHNRIAKTLQSLHPEWSDETLFQEAKRIVTAQIQHITYNEFLPNILGENMMETLDLSPKRDGYWTGYNKSVDPTVSNHFAVAASRLSHAVMEKKLKKETEEKKHENETDRMNKNFDQMKKGFDKIPENVKNNYWFKQSFELLKGNLDFLTEGFLDNNSTEAIEVSSSTTTEEPYSTSTSTEESSSTSTKKDDENSEEHKEDSKSGNRKKRSTRYHLDAVSHDIQRGRDHGLPGYLEWRKYCNLSEVKTFNDLKSIFTKEAFKNISQLYNSIHDIDLYAGALAEKPMPGSMVGPTSACLLADQYYRVKFGDRYWYETQEKPQAFSDKQLSEIKKTSLAGILCANINNLTRVPQKIMWVVDEHNKLVSCADVKQPDLSAWFTPSTYESDVRQDLNELEHDFQRYKPYIDRVDMSLVPAVPEWTSQLNDSVPNLPSYISDWISNRTSKADAVLQYELDQLGEESSKLAKLASCNLTLQTRHVEIFRKKKMHSYKAPREILVNLFHNQYLVWSPNASDSLNNGFKIINKTGEFNIELFKASSDSNYTCIELKPECVYYSKIILGDLVDEENLFEVSVQTVADTCSVLAPVLLKGYYVDEDTFYWTGGLTLYVNEDRNTLNEEEELSSFHTPVRKNWLTLPKLNGTLTVRDHGKWDGKLPVVLNISSLAWYSTSDTLVFPVEWSGFYQGRSSFEGVFLLPQKRNDTYVKWYDGEFSIALPKMLPDLFKELIHSNRVYSSVVYFTSNPSGVDRFDTSVFNKLHDWVFADYSQILIVGRFDEKGHFHWSGDISIHMAPPGYEYASTTYRPYGKYLFKILEGDLYAQLGRSGSVKKWWSGVLPSTVIIPSGEYDVGLHAHVLDQYLIWSYDNFTATDGNGTFRMYQTRSQLKLWGDFEFQFAFLMDGIWTSTLKPNVTYFSPLLLQYERMTYDFGDDMPERLLLAYQRPDLGVLAPITLLGEFHNATAFKWNTEALVTVIQK